MHQLLGYTPQEAPGDLRKEVQKPGSGVGATVWSAGPGLEGVWVGGPQAPRVLCGSTRPLAS